MPAVMEIRYSSNASTTASTDDYNDWNTNTAATEVHQHIWIYTNSASTRDYEPSPFHGYEVYTSRGRNDRKSKSPTSKKFDNFINRIRAIDNERRFRSYRGVPRRKAKVYGKSRAQRRR